MRMQSRYPYEPSENELAALQQKFLGYSTNCLITMRLVVNKQILEVIPTPGNDAILVVYQINTRYNTYAVSIRLALCKINTN